MIRATCYSWDYTQTGHSVARKPKKLVAYIAYNEKGEPLCINVIDEKGRDAQIIIETADILNALLNGKRASK